ncbi:hypothetical protein RSW78_25645, partial [Escherichia coli]|uniref:hypothetical protein n=1 Tax=Escherichia coli TaxID=562 RepID=UPI0028E029EE
SYAQQLLEILVRSKRSRLQVKAKGILKHARHPARIADDERKANIKEVALGQAFRGRRRSVLDQLDEKAIGIAQ